VLFTASEDDSTQIHVHVYGVPEGGAHRKPVGHRVTRAPGVHHAARAGSVLVIASRSLDRPGSRIQVRAAGQNSGTFANLAEVPVLVPRP
jgi:dipeptidyl-peptidase 4